MPDDNALFDATSSSAEPAARAALYADLVSFETRVLEEMLRQAPSLSDAARNEIEAINLAPLRSLIEELRRRRDRWASCREPTGSG